jgi:hypothetical protein
MSGKGRDPFDDMLAQPQSVPGERIQDDPFGDAVEYDYIDERGQGSSSRQRAAAPNSGLKGYALDPFFDE